MFCLKIGFTSSYSCPWSHAESPQLLAHRLKLKFDALFGGIYGSTSKHNALRHKFNGFTSLRLVIVH